tara:strand:- start:617 stop:1585 length:969 start_codon:yes stop_codon:yes gene_type:complete
VKSIGIIIPVFNGESTIRQCLNALESQSRKTYDIAFELIIVDDGSSDGTLRSIGEYHNQQESLQVQVVCFTRNFGKEAAIHAGLTRSREYDAAIVLDADLEHPPELVPSMIEAWQSGAMVVEGIKNYRGSERVTSTFLAKFFYNLFSFFTELNIKNSTDFKLLDKTAVDAFCTLPESNRFFRGLMKWMDYPTQQIYFDVPRTEIRQSAWSLFSLIRYAVSSITSFSAFPLQLVTLLGAVTFFISLVIGGVALYDKVLGQAVDGFTTVILLVLIIGSVLMFSIGIIGIYIGKIYEEVKRRPSYKILKIETFDTSRGTQNNYDS